MLLAATKFSNKQGYNFCSAQTLVNDGYQTLLKRESNRVVDHEKNIAHFDTFFLAALTLLASSLLLNLFEYRDLYHSQKSVAGWEEGANFT